MTQWGAWLDGTVVFEFLRPSHGNLVLWLGASGISHLYCILLWITQYQFKEVSFNLPELLIAVSVALGDLGWHVWKRLFLTFAVITKLLFQREILNFIASCRTQNICKQPKLQSGVACLELQISRPEFSSHLTLASEISTSFPLKCEPCTVQGMAS